MSYSVSPCTVVVQLSAHPQISITVNKFQFLFVNWLFGVRTTCSVCMYLLFALDTLGLHLKVFFTGVTGGVQLASELILLSNKFSTSLSDITGVRYSSIGMSKVVEQKSVGEGDGSLDDTSSLLQLQQELAVSEELAVDQLQELESDHSQEDELEKDMTELATL